MTRPVRIEYAGAWYHVMNRGSGRRTIFENSYSYQLFLELLDEVSNRFGVQVHAYCLMKNHYHLLLHTPLPNLNKVMKSIGGVFTQRINTIAKTDGPLFRGRYKAILVDVDSYLLQLSRYIHLNPVAAKIVKHPEEYLWSSYQHYISSKNKPDWLYCHETLSHFGRLEPTLLYKEFVLEGVKEANSLYDKLKVSTILGSESFIEKLKSAKDRSEVDPEVFQNYKPVQNKIPTISEVIYGASICLKVDPLTLMNRQRTYTEKLASNLAVYLSLEMTGESQNKIGIEFGGISKSRVSQIYRLVKQDLLNNMNLREKTNEIKKYILTLNTWPRWFYWTMEHIRNH